MGTRRCTECGAGLASRAAQCPLCGAAAADQIRAAKPVAVSEIERYQADVRRLREQLKEMRGARSA
jgi:hypothetical protein